MDKKGAIGLSVNILVTIIISLVVLTGGIKLLYDFIQGSEDIKAQLDAKTEAELERILLDGGEKVAIYSDTAAIARGKGHVFGIGILNIEKKSFGENFEIKVELSSAFDETKKPITIPQGEIQGWLLFDGGPFVIEENKYHTEPILISVPAAAQKGTYIFNVRVTCVCPTINTNCAERKLCNPYDNIKKLNVVVE